MQVLLEMLMVIIQLTSLFPSGQHQIGQYGSAFNYVKEKYLGNAWP